MAAIFSEVFVAPSAPSQILEDQKPVAQTPQHGNPHVHASLCHVWRNPPLRLLAFRLGPQHGQRTALPLLWQERDKIHHQVARDPPAAHRVQAALQVAQGRCDSTQPDTLHVEAAWWLPRSPGTGTKIASLQPQLCPTVHDTWRPHSPQAHSPSVVQASIYLFVSGTVLSCLRSFPSHDCWLSSDQKRCQTVFSPQILNILRSQVTLKNNSVTILHTEITA